MLIQQSYRPSDPEKLAKALSLVDRIGKNIRLYRLGCNMDPSAAKTSYYGMAEPGGLKWKQDCLTEQELSERNIKDEVKGRIYHA